MKNAKYFDVHDRDVTPEIYTLLFSGILFQLSGNDNFYEFSDPLESFEASDYAEEAWNKRLARGSRNCYFDNKKMEQFSKNPCSAADAVNRFKEWLKNKGVTESDTVIVKVWW